MELGSDIVWIIISIAVVIGGADQFTDGASALARRLKVPSIVVGLTVVAFGTSAPELFVSLTSAAQGSAGMAVGNVMGSNIFNVLLIVGLSAVVAPFLVSKSTVKKDVPWAVGATVLLLLLCMDGHISRVDGLLLLAGFVAFMVYTLRMARTSGEEETDPVSSDVSVGSSVALILCGLAALVLGSNVFVSRASDVASALGVSDAVIGLTVVAGGTSLPELATSIVAARKGQAALAIGNVVGSNVFNVLLILGLASMVRPLGMEGITVVDFALFAVSILLMWLMCRTSYKVTRWEGVILFILFLAYISWLVFHAI